MPNIRVRDIEMNYKIHGSRKGEPLILLHGFTGSGDDFNPFLGKLGEQYKLYIPDLRGHGQTINPTANIVHAELARDTASFVSKLGLTRAHFCGFSTGAMHLLFLAIDNPLLFQSLTLVSATYTFDDYAKMRVRGVREAAQMDWIDSLNAIHGKTHGGGYADILLDLWVESVLRPNELPFSREDLHKISCPTIIIHGDRDEFFPINIPVTMYESIPESQLCILPNCHHGLPWEINPDLFTTILLNFLTKHRMAY